MCTLDCAKSIRSTMRLTNLSVPIAKYVTTLAQSVTHMFNTMPEFSCGTLFFTNFLCMPYNNALVKGLLSKRDNCKRSGQFGVTVWVTNHAKQVVTIWGSTASMTLLEKRSTHLRTLDQPGLVRCCGRVRPRVMTRAGDLLIGFDMRLIGFDTGLIRFDTGDWLSNI